MSQPAKEIPLMEKVVSLCKRRGFIFQSSEIYGGLNGFWDYGPLGAELKRNVKDLWWKSMTKMRDDVAGLDATIIMHPQIWKASGHVETFADPMVDCLLTKKRFRADQIEPQSGVAYFYTGAKDETRELPEPYSVLLAAGKPPESARKAAVQFYQERGMATPELLGERTEKIENTTRYNPENGSLLTEPKMFNLMFKTFVGATESEDSVAYLRPETAQAIFAQFKNVLDTSRQKVPFGIAQIGKAFRNEINPRNFTFRSREFEQMELEFFIKPGTDADWHQKWVAERLKWYETIGLPKEKLSVYEYKKEELAHYASACVDVMFAFPFGVQELEGIAARGNFDLSQHQKFSGKSMEYFDDETKEKYIPHVVEPSAGVDRICLALICAAYTEEEIAPGDVRIVMKFAPRIAPVKVAVFPLLRNKPPLVEKARQVFELLQSQFTTEWDDRGNIGKRYRYQDEQGTPWCVTVDFDTLGEKGPELLDTVTVRDRDTMQQDRVKITNLVPLIAGKLRGNK